MLVDRQRCVCTRLLVILAAVTFGVAITPATRAETGRTLGGYTYIPSPTVDTPFITHHFTNTVGFATGNVPERPVLIIDTTPPDTLYSLGGSVLFVVVGLNYQHVLTDRLALFAEGAGASRIGTSGSSLLSQGVTAVTAFELGILGELWRRERVLLSGEAGVGWGSTILISIAQMLEDLSTTGTGSLFNQAQGSTIRAALIGAWTLNHWSGLVARAGAGYSFVEELAENVLWDLSLSWNGDLAQRGDTPVGFTAFADANHNLVTTSETGTSYAFGGGIFYTGRPDAAIGMEMEARRIPLPDDDFWATAVAVTIRYFF